MLVRYLIQWDYNYVNKYITAEENAFIPETRLKKDYLLGSDA